MKNIWITWEKHRRTEQLASALPKVDLFEFTLDANRLVRYPYLLFKSTLTLIRERPDLVIVQNPSIILAIFVITVGNLMKFHVVVDSHNEGIMPFYSRYNLLLPIYALIQKWAELTIVTNEELAKVVRKNGGTPFVLPDRMPQLYNPNFIKLKGDRNVVFTCSFAKDEPFLEVIQAAHLIDPSIYVYITGRYQNAPKGIISKTASNVIFTGYIPDETYINLLNSCDIVIDLTLMQDCLVCGAYEAVALGKPLILSDTQALRNYFYQGAVYTKNHPDAIAFSIKSAIDNRVKLINEVSMLKNELQYDWNRHFEKFISLLKTYA